MLFRLFSWFILFKTFDVTRQSLFQWNTFPIKWKRSHQKCTPNIVVVKCFFNQCKTVQISCYLKKLFEAQDSAFFYINRSSIHHTYLFTSPKEFLITRYCFILVSVFYTKLILFRRLQCSPSYSWLFSVNVLSFNYAPLLPKPFTRGRKHLVIKKVECTEGS